MNILKVHLTLNYSLTVAVSFIMPRGSVTAIWKSLIKPNFKLIHLFYYFYLIMVPERGSELLIPKYCEQLLEESRIERKTQ